MGLGYSTTLALSRIDAGLPLVMGGFGIAFACFAIWYIVVIIKGFKDKHVGMPWQANMWNFANDFCFVFVGFGNIWTPGLETNHWFMHLQWFGMAVWFIAEIIVHVQTIKWDIHEVFPHVQKKSTAIVLYCLAEICFVALYAWLLAVIDDPMIMIMIGTTIFCSMCFYPMFLGEREDTSGTKGINMFSIALVTVAQAAWWFFTTEGLDPTFGNGYSYLLGVCAVGIGIFSMVKFHNMKKAEQAKLEKEGN